MEASAISGVSVFMDQWEVISIDFLIFSNQYGAKGDDKNTFNLVVGTS